MTTDLAHLLEGPIAARTPLLDARHEEALRLFNGFVEGLPGLVLDVYGRTLVLHDHAPGPQGDEPLVREALALVLARLPFLTAAVWKIRNAPTAALRNGTILHGTAADLTRRVRENGCSYALSLLLNRDASLYLDTRGLRAWAAANLSGQRVLNTFAYTGSLGVAARAGGADVLHTDLNRAFLTVAKDSYTLNGFPIDKSRFRTGDFFDVLGQLKRAGSLFDCVFLDPPFFSVTGQGRVDLEAGVARLVNKVRPVLADGGTLVVVNNALFVSGAEFHATLEELCRDGYLTLEALMPVPDDTAGFAHTRRGEPLTDPAPFNHSTKIARLRARRKDGRR